MPKVDVFNLKREKVGELELSDEVFGAEVKEQLFYEVVKAQLASRRSGTAAQRALGGRGLHEEALPSRRAPGARVTARSARRSSSAAVRRTRRGRATGATVRRARCASAH